MTGNKTNQQEGMTLIEMLVSLVVLTVGLIPIFSVIVSSSNLATRAKNNLIAANLAQEGIEVVRAIRDKAWLEGVPYDRDLSNGDYLVSWNSSTLTPYDSEAYLKFDSNSGLYSLVAGIDTIFKRKISVLKVVSACNCEVSVTSAVTWSERGQNKSVTVEDHLFDWNR